MLVCTNCESCFSPMDKSTLEHLQKDVELFHRHHVGLSKVEGVVCQKFHTILTIRYVQTNEPGAGNN